MDMAAESHTIAASLDLSYRHLSPAQQQFFCRLGVHPGTSIDSYAAASVAGTSAREATAQLDALHREGMLTELGYRRYGMHDLVRRYARDIASGAPAATAPRRWNDCWTTTSTPRLSARTCWLARPAPRARQLQTVPAEFPALSDRGKALAWARAERQNLMACTGPRAVPVTSQARRSHRCGRGHPGNRWPVGRRRGRHAVAAAAARSCGDDARSRRALSALGAVLSLTGDSHGAAARLAEALGIYRDVADRQGQANALHSLAGALRTLGDQQAATADLPVPRHVPCPRRPARSGHALPARASSRG